MSLKDEIQQLNDRDAKTSHDNLNLRQTQQRQGEELAKYKERALKGDEISKLCEGEVKRIKAECALKVKACEDKLLKEHSRSLHFEVEYRRMEE